MIAAIVIFVVVVVAVIAAAAWSVSRTKRANVAPEKGVPSLCFRWRYIILPLAVLAASGVVSAFFYSRIPADIVAYHFQPDGTPDKWLSRPFALVWVLAPQVVLTLVAAGIVRGIVGLNVFNVPQAFLRPQAILAFMGNLVGLPQLIVAFVMLDIFSYNAYRTHFPVWLFLLVVLGLSAVGLFAFFVVMIARVNRQMASRKD